jgi:polyphosphate kinase
MATVSSAHEGDGVRVDKKLRVSRNGSRDAAAGAPPRVPKRYFNRELSWLEFNARVLEEAMDESHPLLERAKFLAIFHSNLDEFFMIRVSGLKEQVESGLTEPSPDGLTPREQIALIRERVLAQHQATRRYFHDDLKVKLAQTGIHLYDYRDLTKQQKAALKEYFITTVYPILTPLAVDPGHPFPHISNLSLSLAVVIQDRDKRERFARVKIPQVLPRLVPVDMSGGKADGTQARARKYGFVWMEQLVAAHLDMLFRGMKVLQSFPFRVVRDADLEIREDEAGDLLQTIELSLSRRRFGFVTRLAVTPEMPEHIRGLLIHNLEIEPEDVYVVDGPLGLSDLMALYDLDAPHLKDPPFRPRIPAALRAEPDIFASIRKQDILLHHPYDSFQPVIEFVQTAAADPDVLAIKQTIYRVGKNSPIVAALAEAGENGKQVSAMVELKARFDEENNIGWARALENAGVHVVYGDIELKTHCKVLLVVRREPDGIRRYVHMSTGNYNARTARVYTDLGLFTCDADIGEDATALFNVLTGYSVNAGYRKLLVSPGGIRKGLIERIEREIEHVKAGRGGYIVFKMNSLTDFKSADVLYRASQAGVKIDLIIRSSCILVPGVEGLSDNIRVVSIVGRFLEHHRIYYFQNGGQGQDEVWLGSADMMQRNLDRRVETLFPIENPKLKKRLIQEVLMPHLRDNRKARLLLPDGTYRQVTPGPEEPSFNAQEWFLNPYAEPEVPSPVETKPKPAARVGD